jgi:small basic protein
VENALASQARLLYRTALAIFVVTIVIGILNGLDVWTPERNVLLTHVHAGTLGWITLSVVATAMLMFGEGIDQKSARTAQRLALTVVGAVVIYVAAFLAGTGIYRPIAGTLMLLAIVWTLVWVSGRYRQTPSTTSRLALLLATISLTLGAVLGVLLGLFIARGSLPGLSEEAAGNLAGAHPPAMLIGYLILAGVAISHWVLGGTEARLGRMVAWVLFISGLIINIAIIFDVEPLIQVATLLEVSAIVAFIVHMWSRIKPAAWAGGGSANFARTSVIFLAVGIGLLVYVVQLFVSGQLDPESGEGAGVLIAFDHSMFIGVMTNSLFASIAALAGASTSYRVVIWGTNAGLVGFLVGLAAESAALKRISTPIMGLALLMGIYTFFMRLNRSGTTASV